MTVKQVAIRLKTDGKAEVKRDFAEVGAAGDAAQKRIAEAADKATGSTRRLLSATDEQMEKYRAIAAAARAAQDAQEAQARFNVAAGIGRASGKSARDSAETFTAARGRGLTTMQRSTLIYTASDVVASAASGINPGMIALQQGGQLAQAFIVGSEGAGRAAIMLAGQIGGVAAVLGTLTAATLRHKAVVMDLGVVMEGIGARSGITAGELERMATAVSKTGLVSAAAAREMGVAYASTGMIGEDVTRRLIALTTRYGAAVRLDAKAATSELGSAFTDPARGADLLNAKLGLLDDATTQYIRKLISQNQNTEAQVVLLQRLEDRLSGASTRVNVLGSWFERLKIKADNAGEAMGRAMDKLLGGGSPEDRVAHGQFTLASQPWLQLPLWSKAKAKVEGQIATARGEIRAQRQAASEQTDNWRAQDVRDAIDRANPSAALLRQKRADLAKIQNALGSGEAGPDALKAVDTLKADIHALANGYKTATGEASALARQQREAAAAARKAAQEALKEAKEDNRLAELKADNELTVIKLRMGQRGDYDLTTLRAQAEELERQIRLRQMVAQFVGAGAKPTEALTMAEVQLGKESKATWEGMVADASKPIPGLIATTKAMKELGEQVGRINKDQDAINEMGQVGVNVFDRLSDRLVNSGRSFQSWRDTISDVLQDISAEFMKLAVLNPIKNALFSGVSGYSKAPTISSISGFLGGLFGSGKSAGSAATGFMAGLEKGAPFGNFLGGGVIGGLAKLLIGRNAVGTDDWRGGLTWVGEQGPELVNLPRGTGVFSNARSNAMASAASTINVHIHAEGAVLTDTVRGWVAEGVSQAIRESGANVPGIVNDGLSRRYIKPVLR